MATLPELASESSKARRILEDPTINHSLAARMLSEEFGKTRLPESVRMYRLRNGWLADPKQDNDIDAEESAPVVGAGKANVTSEGGEFVNVILDHPVMDDNFDHVFQLFNLDPTIYTIVDNTVRMSTWQQSKALEDGTRDLVQLYSYSCRFKKTSASAITEDDFEERRSRVLGWRPEAPRRTPGSGLGEASTFVINWADWQLGKSEGGGVAATEQRVLDSFDMCQTRIDELRKIGRNIESVAIVNMGDPVEGCMGNYASQTFTVELTQRRQLLLAMDLFQTGILHFASQEENFKVLGVLCNHGEWNRVGGKAATSDSDNAGGFIMDAVQRVVTARDDMDHIEWVIPQDEMCVMSELSGVWCAFTHGHKIPSGTQKNEEAWLTAQSIHLLRTYGHEPKLWTTAHKHHATLTDVGPFHRIQCSALDGGSKWYLDARGKWSTAGTTTYLAGTHDVRGFSDYAVLSS